MHNFEELVCLVLNDRKAGLSRSAIAKKYNITLNQARKIIRYVMLNVPNVQEHTETLLEDFKNTVHSHFTKLYNMSDSVRLTETLENYIYVKSSEFNKLVEYLNVVYKVNIGMELSNTKEPKIINLYSVYLKELYNTPAQVQPQQKEEKDMSQTFERFRKHLEYFLSARGRNIVAGSELLRENLLTFFRTKEQVQNYLVSVQKEFGSLDVSNVTYLGCVYRAVKERAQISPECTVGTILQEEPKKVETRDETILRLASEGRSQQQIANLLRMARSTVGDIIRRHRSSVEPVKVEKVYVTVDNVDYSEEAPEDSWTAGYNFINLYYQGKSYTASKTNPNFDAAFKLLVEDNDIAGAVELINVRKAIENYVDGDIKIIGNVLTYQDIVLDTSMTRRIIQNMREGKEFKNLVRFLSNLVLNPRREAVYELFDFLQCSSIEITEDGYFLAYKKVRSDYMDIYSNTISNKPGEKPEMLAFEVDPDRDNTCSQGLHVCSEGYLPHFGSSTGNKVVLCKVNPAHVVAVPSDYKNQKMRVWKYEVLEDVTERFYGSSY